AATGEPRYSEDLENLSRQVVNPEHLQPLPEHDYFEFFANDSSLYPHMFSRAYINFKNQEDIVLFRDRFDEKREERRRRELERKRQREEERRKWKEEERRKRKELFRRREEEVKKERDLIREKGKKSDLTDFTSSMDKSEKVTKDDKKEDTIKRDRIRNKDRPAMQLYQPGARSRSRLCQYEDSAAKPTDQGVDKKQEREISNMKEEE
uniref:UPF3B regulator of nonsense mediated mRNA decay n=1 Tax=Athene cunicularia TaxID=194338 RepID=A0A663M641_ATHCN